MTYATLTVSLGKPYIYKNTFGDTWFSSQMNGKLLSISCDTKGWYDECGPYGSNMAIHIMSGNLKQADGLDGHILSDMKKHPYDFGAWGTYKYDEDGIRRMWKANDILCDGNAIYVSVSRHGEMMPHTKYRQDAVNASIIKSEDGASNWSKTENECYLHPMFSGKKFPIPCFVKYDCDPTIPDGSDQFYYMVSNEGYWNNGSCFYLCRVPKKNDSILCPDSYEFFCGMNQGRPQWSKNAMEKAPVLSEPFQLSMAGVQYLSAVDRYVMLQAYYPEPYPTNFNTAFTRFRFYESRFLWGPWTPFFECESDTGCYTPAILQGSIEKKGSSCSMVILTAGDWRTCMEPETVYRMTAMQLTISIQ